MVPWIFLTIQLMKISTQDIRFGKLREIGLKGFKNHSLKQTNTIQIGEHVVLLALWLFSGNDRNRCCSHNIFIYSCLKTVSWSWNFVKWRDAISVKIFLFFFKRVSYRIIPLWWSSTLWGQLCRNTRDAEIVWIFFCSSLFSKDAHDVADSFSVNTVLITNVFIHWKLW